MYTFDSIVYNIVVLYYWAICLTPQTIGVTWNSVVLNVCISADPTFIMCDSIISDCNTGRTFSDYSIIDIIGDDILLDETGVVCIDTCIKGCDFVCSYRCCASCVVDSKALLCSCSWDGVPRNCYITSGYVDAALRIWSWDNVVYDWSNTRSYCYYCSRRGTREITIS